MQQPACASKVSPNSANMKEVVLSEGLEVFDETYESIKDLCQSTGRAVLYGLRGGNETSRGINLHGDLESDAPNAPWSDRY